MDPVVEVMMFTTIAGLGLPLGGLLSTIGTLRPDWLVEELRHGIIAFGGGILVAAVALVLVPEGAPALPAIAAVTAFVIGGISFMFLDRALARRGTHASMLLAALLDFAPEAIALGATMVAQPNLGLLLTLIISFQNVPEGFNAARELVAAGVGARSVLALLAVLVLVGPLCGILGLLFLAEMPLVTGTIMLFAAGGILYLTFQDVAPQIHLEKTWAPPVGAVLGFATGLAFDDSSRARGVEPLRADPHRLALGHVAPRSVRRRGRPDPARRSSRSAASGLGVSSRRVGRRARNFWESWWSKPTVNRWVLSWLWLVSCGGAPGRISPPAKVASPAVPDTPRRVVPCRVGVESLALEADAFDIEAADLDADGRIELVVAGRDGVRAIRDPLGKARSTMLSDRPVLELAIARDTDGIAHLLVRADSQTEIWRNDGAGQFTPGERWPLASPIAVADLDGDGRDDLVATTSSGMSVVFSVSASTPALEHLSSDVKPGWLASGDINADGADEIVVGNDVWIQVFEGASDRVLRRGRAIRIPTAYGGAIADLDGDGRGELITSSAGPVVLGFSEDLRKAERRPYRYRFRPIDHKLVVADIDGDGIVDVSALSAGGADGLLVWPGLGASNLGAARTWWRPSGNRTVRDYVVADLDGDGRADVADVSDAPTVDIMLGHGQAAHAPGSPLRRMDTVSVADLDDDGHLDVVVTADPGPRRPKGAFPLFVASGRGDGTFADFEVRPVSEACPVGPVLSSDSGALGLAAIVPGSQRRPASVPGKVQVTTNWAGFAPSLRFLVFGDDGTFEPVGEEGLRLSVWPIGVAAAQGEAGRFWAVLYPPDQRWVDLVSDRGRARFALPAPATHVVAGDPNAEGDVDFLVTIRDGHGDRYVQLRSGSRLLVAETFDLAPHEQATFADLDRDGSSEIVVVGSDTIRWTTMGTDGSFRWRRGARGRPQALEERSLVEVLPLSTAIAIVDTDGVEHMALSDGVFTTTAYTPSSFRLASAAAGDFDEDGSADVVAVGMSSSPLVIATATCE